MAVCSIIWCVKLISRLWYPFSFEVSYTLSYTLNIAWLLFIAAVLLVVCLPGLKIFAEKLSALWFVPIILISGEWVAYNCTQKYWFRMLIYAYANVPHWYKIFDLIEVAAVVFFCLWLWYDWGKPKWTKKAPVVAEAAPVLSVADQLLHYKELLDMGAITQEEFDAKKKELLS